jgi:rod shape determining protein RodA
LACQPRSSTTGPTIATLLPVYLGIVYLAGLRLKLLGIGLLVLVLLSPAIWKWGLQDYQKGRVITFLNPELDPRGDGWQQIQAKVTVGSGGLFGKGFRQGTQGAYRFLPEGHNDFVFAYLPRNTGFSGYSVLGSTCS